MPLRVDIDIRDDATPELSRIAASLKNRRPLHAALGKRGEIELRAHFAQRDTVPNSRGWKSLHFWGRIRKATAYGGADAAGARVIIADPAMNQKVHGGTIKPREGKFLAIPARQEAYGRSPRVFHDLHFVALSGGRGMLVQNVQTALERHSRGKLKGQIKSAKETGGGVFYWLVKSVTQAADRNALPPREGFLAAMLDETRKFLARRGVEEIVRNSKG